MIKHTERKITLERVSKDEKSEDEKSDTLYVFIDISCCLFPMVSCNVVIFLVGHKIDYKNKKV